MYRIITKYRTKGGSRPVVERGPWHPTLQAAEQWADMLRQLGYAVSIEGQQSGFGSADDDDHGDNSLAEALANMA